LIRKLDPNVVDSMSSNTCVHPIYPPSVELSVEEYIHRIGRNSKVDNNDDDVVEEEEDEEKRRVLWLRMM
jgi:hypothetical protein